MLKQQFSGLGVRRLLLSSVRIGLIETRASYADYRAGIFWVLISYAILLSMMGPVYSLLFFGSIDPNYLTYLAISISAWQFCTSCISNASVESINSRSRLLNSRIDLFLISTKIVFQAAQIFLMQHAVYILVSLSLGVGYFEHFSPGGFLIVCATFVMSAYVIGVISIIYPDLSFLIRNAVQISFFVTPVFWRRDQININDLLIDINPLALLMDSIRGGLSTKAAIILFALYFAGTLATFFYFRKKMRIVISRKILEA